MSRAPSCHAPRIVIAGVCLVLAACASKPLVPYTTDTPPLVLAPAAQAGIVDKRARFREIYCAVLEARRELPDHRSCDEALTRVGDEPAGTARPVDLGPSNRRLVAAMVPGLGFECFEKWLEPPGTCFGARPPVRIRPGGDQGRLSVRHRNKRAPDPGCHFGDAGRAGPAAACAAGLLKGSARHPRGARHLSGNPQSSCRRGQPGGRGWRVTTGERCEAISGRHVAPFPRLNLRVGRWRRGCEPAAGHAQSLARDSFAPEGNSLLLAGHVSAAGAYFCRC